MYKILDLMNIRAGLEEYILQTHNTNFFEDSMGGGVWTPLTPPPLGTPVLDTVDESQRRRHGVTAAIVVDVVGALRPCVSSSVKTVCRLCPFVRSCQTTSKRRTDGQSDGVWHIPLMGFMIYLKNVIFEVGKFSVCVQGLGKARSGGQLTS